jgi:NAD(P)-dependent dehydrogenase (short-subunit alcohol dehydrogenase family)
MAREWIDKQGDTAAVVKELSALHPLGRIGEPEDIANACLFLASDEAS